MKTIGFCNQKGGVGKTTLAKMLASFLAYELKEKVAFIDADAPQFSAHFYRENELKNYDTPEELYPILPCNLADVTAAISKFNNEGYEYIIVDLPGSASNDNMINAVTSLNIVFIPTQVEQKSAEASYRFGALLASDYLDNPNCNLKHAYFLWTMFSNTESSVVYDVLRTKVFPNNPYIKFLNEKMTYSVAYKSNDLCSTIKAIKKERVKKHNLNTFNLLTEIHNTINE